MNDPPLKELSVYGLIAFAGLIVIASGAAFVNLVGLVFALLFCYTVALDEIQVWRAMRAIDREHEAL